jgi:hypothetical protein
MALRYQEWKDGKAGENVSVWYIINQHGITANIISSFPPSQVNLAAEEKKQ